MGPGIATHACARCDLSTLILQVQALLVSNLAHLQVHDAGLDGGKGLFEAQEGEGLTGDVKGISGLGLR